MSRLLAITDCVDDLEVVDILGVAAGRADGVLTLVSYWTIDIDASCSEYSDFSWKAELLDR